MSSSGCSRWSKATARYKRPRSSTVVRGSEWAHFERYAVEGWSMESLSLVMKATRKESRSAREA